MWNNKIIVIKEGQLITGRDKLAKQTGIHRSSIERILDFLENEHQIEQQKTTKFRLITIVNWNEYQNVDSKMSNKRATNEQQMSTYKNDNNDKNEKKENIATPHGQLEEKPKEKPLTNIQQVVNYFFSLKGWDINGSGGDKVYSRYVRPAKDLLGLCENSVSEAQACIKKIADWADSRNLDWGLETIFKKWYELDLLKPKEKKPYYEGNRIFEMGGKRFVLMPNGEKMEFAGKESEIKYK